MAAKIVVLGFSLDAKDKRFINKMLGAAFPGEVPEIIDLQSYQYRPGNELILISIGNMAARQVSQTQHTRYAAFRALPELEELDPDTGDDVVRQATWELLQQMRPYLDVPDQSEQSTSLTPDQLPDVEKDPGSRGWVGVTKDGKSIRLTPRPTLEGSEDIQMTFAELQALKTAAELLGVREFELVPSNQADPSPSSSNSGE